MDRIRDLIGREDLADRPRGPSPKSLESQPVNEERHEYYLQTMEVVLETAEDILGSSVDDAVEPERIERAIIQKAAEKGAHPSRTQKAWLHEKVFLWSEDVVKGAATIKALSEDSGGKNREEDTAKPSYYWKDLENNTNVQREMLKYLAVLNKDPANYNFFCDHPPMVIIRCLRLEDYAALSPYDETEKSEEKTLGFAACFSRVFVGAPEELEMFNYKVGFMRPGTNKATCEHEAEHLFYNRYIVDKKAMYLREVDELVAYIKSDPDHEISTRQAFSQYWGEEHKSKLLEIEYFDSEWIELRLLLKTLKYSGIKTGSLLNTFRVSSSLQELSRRLHRIRIDDSKLEIPEDDRPEMHPDNIEWFLFNKDLYTKGLEPGVGLDIQDMFWIFFCERLQVLRDLVTESGRINLSSLNYLKKLLDKFKDYLADLVQNSGMVIMPHREAYETVPLFFVRLVERISGSNTPSLIDKLRSEIRNIWQEAQVAGNPDSFSAAWEETTKMLESHHKMLIDLILLPLVFKGNFPSPEFDGFVLENYGVPKFLDLTPEDRAELIHRIVQGVGAE